MANPSNDCETPAQHASKHIVETSYDQIAPRYLEWATSHSYTSSRLLYTQKLLTFFNKTSKILELGCGAGVPCTQLLAQSHHVTGNDISAAQIELARKHVPNSEFVKGDMMSLEFEKGRFGAVVAFYSVIHLPREEQGVMLRRIWGWLEDGGYLLMNLGARDDPGSVNENWLGGKMYWSGFDAATNVQMVRNAGFDMMEEEIIQEEEDGTTVPFLWILARKRMAERS